MKISSIDQSSLFTIASHYLSVPMLRVVRSSLESLLSSTVQRNSWINLSLLDSTPSALVWALIKQAQAQSGDVQVLLKRKDFILHTPPQHTYTKWFQSLENKLEELRARLLFRKEIMDWYVVSFTETWLSLTHQTLLYPNTFSLHCMDCT